MTVIAEMGGALAKIPDTRWRLGQMHRSRDAHDAQAVDFTRSVQQGYVGERPQAPESPCVTVFATLRAVRRDT